MAKRLIDTELWNNEDIIENFTAEDKYFWLYLLTSPHNTVCGVFKNKPALIARDMGLHKDTITNLLYRFQTVHHLIYADKETDEIIILNWSKYNWTKSADFMKTVIKQAETIQSSYIKCLLQDKINEKMVDSPKTVLTPSKDGTITNTTTNPNVNSYEVINYLNKVCGTSYKTTTNKTQSLINARIKEKFTLDDFKLVIDSKYKEWGNDDKMKQYLRPETLFGTKFESYLQNAKSSSNKTATTDDDPYAELRRLTTV